MTSENMKLRHGNNTNDYGTNVLIKNGNVVDNDFTLNKVIFCVHGKLSGCCTVIKGEKERHSFTDYQLTPALIEDHCHRERDEFIDKKARKKLIIASILCVIFMIMEIIGGIWSNSLAIATDAAHLLTDFTSFMISLFSIWMANRPATKKMPFGWYRAEVIGALTSVLLIWIVTGVLLFLAIERIINKNFELDAFVMLITSAIGVIVNLIMGLTLHQHGHEWQGHSHVDDHENYDIHHHNKTHEENSYIQPQNKNINVRAAFIHVIGDFIQSTGVFIAAICIYFKPTWSIADPVCTVFFSFLVTLTTVAIIKDVMNVLMEGIPNGFDYTQVENTLMQIDGVIKVHNLRVWALSLDKTALSAHLVIVPETSPQTILRTATRIIHDKYQFFEMTLQIEEFNQKMEECRQCKPPLP